MPPHGSGCRVTKYDILVHQSVRPRPLMRTCGLKIAKQNAQQVCRLARSHDYPPLASAGKVRIFRVVPAFNPGQAFKEAVAEKKRRAPKKSTAKRTRR